MFGSAPDTGFKVGLYMIALVVGYFVRYFAEKSDKEMKVLGKIISMLIILFSAALIIYSVLHHLRYGWL